MLKKCMIPAVESEYITYAENTDIEGIKASREHRAFGGFSMGSVTTWYTFINCLDAFKYFMPISGDCWAIQQMGGSGATVETAKYLNEVAQKSGYSTTDYYIYALTGTEDIAYDNLTPQIEEMKKYTERFVYNSDFTKGNFYYGVGKAGVHDYTSMIKYIYNALPTFFIKK